VIDTGVDISHPVLQPVLLPGYDFTRNQPGASEMAGCPTVAKWREALSRTMKVQVVVQQSRSPSLDQSSVAVLDGGPYTRIWSRYDDHRTSSPRGAEIQDSPSQGFYLQRHGISFPNIVAALYYAVQHQANVVNMSFDVPTSSAALSQAVSYCQPEGRGSGRRCRKREHKCSRVPRQRSMQM